ncbi:hypothetical protein BDF20DRAFT_883414 [Mycotypha africana]|uniref:uncharacterized protein n=1 Tax=Mycotypha africana TaxID=64632 RepID=UPI0023019105|nr:uncharacterized protein BDF20DRAFT_883414 [Mycotypha africana]KAI8973646.1 hypothetical protein BDF20DRAFT_883414 [Mycotypha africana]
MTLRSATDRLGTHVYDQQPSLSKSAASHATKNRPDSTDKDRFIELAQAALEEAHLEEERKGVLQEVMEALVSKTGAPLVADVISQQLHSQDVIERLCEIHQQQRDQLNQSPYLQQQQQQQQSAKPKKNKHDLHKNDTQYPHSSLKDETTAISTSYKNNKHMAKRHTPSSPPLPRMLRAESVESMKAPDDELYESKTDESCYYNVYDDDESPLKLLFMLHPHYRTKENTAYVFAEYLWRLFRLLLLASLVGLVCHFLHSTS